MPILIGQRPDHGFGEPLGLLNDCHRRIEYFLRVLVAVDQQAAGGPLGAGQRADLEGALKYFATAAQKHTADEEESLFPRLRASNDPAATRALELLERLERDHDDAEQHHCSIDILGRRWLTVGSLDAIAAGALRAHLVSLQAIYQQHIRLEDRDLFPRAALLLSTAELLAIGREMAVRRSKPAMFQP